MDRKRKLQLAAGTTAVAALVGGGAAVAATKLPDPGTESKALIDDAAGRLNVSPTALTDALKKAVEDRVDAAVQAGNLTKAQGDALKQKIDAITYPNFNLGGVLPGLGRGRLPVVPGARPMMPGMPGMPGIRGLGGVFGAGLGAATDYLQITQAQLRTELASGKSLAEIATAHGKTADGLVTALTTAAKKQIEAAVTSGKLSRAQADSLETRLQQGVTMLVNAKGLGGFFGRGGAFGFGLPGAGAKGHAA
jgi:hypothetical protein